MRRVIEKVFQKSVPVQRSIRGMLECSKGLGYPIKLLIFYQQMGNQTFHQASAVSSVSASVPLPCLVEVGYLTKSLSRYRFYGESYQYEVISQHEARVIQKEDPPGVPTKSFEVFEVESIPTPGNLPKNRKIMHDSHPKQLPKPSKKKASEIGLFPPSHSTPHRIMSETQ